VRTGVVALALVAVVAGCGGKKRQRRSGDAGTPVEVIIAPVDAGKAGETDEVEPNNTPDVASALALGGSVRGRIEPDDDVDTYRIDVAEAGALDAQLTATDGVDLAIEVEDAAGAVIVRSDRGGAKTVEGVPNLGVSPGRYTINVRKIPPKVKKPPRGRKAPPPPEPPPPGSAPVYHLTAQVKPFPPNAEREPDDDRGTANDLIAGAPATGYIGWTGDADVWKLSLEALSANNLIDIELGAIDGVALQLEVSDGVGQPLLSRKGGKNTKLVVRNLAPQVPQGAPPFHYLTIRAVDKSNPETPYQLTVTGGNRELDAELEPDDSADKAMPFPTERTLVKGRWSPGDVDYYALQPDDTARTLEVVVAPIEEASLSVELIVDGKSVAEGKKPGKGTEQRISGAVPPGARAVIRVRGSDSSPETEYRLTVNDGAPAPPP
jgi:hypothetical protein